MEMLIGLCYAAAGGFCVLLLALGWADLKKLI